MLLMQQQIPMREIMQFLKHWILFFRSSRKKTRYSPLIIDLLIFIAELRDNLRELLISGRKESYEFVYLLPDSS